MYHVGSISSKIGVARIRQLRETVTLMSQQAREFDAPLGGSADLLSRLRHMHQQGRPVVFVVGAPVSAAPDGTGPGVPQVAGMVDLVREQYHDNADDLRALEEELLRAENLYQTAFGHLNRRRGPEAPNQVVRTAVLRAYTGAVVPPLPLYLGDELERRCSALEDDLQGWHLPPATKALGQLAACAPAVFGSCILTTNFDPLLHIAVRAAGGKSLRTVLDQDGNHAQSHGEGCHIVHLHGHWYRSDTLHTPAQLGMPRPQLKRSLERLIAHRTVLVLACGGWDDIFNSALAEVLSDGNQRPDVLWTFFDGDHERVRQRHAGLLGRLTPGIRSGRVNLYCGIDAHTFVPQLLAQIEGERPASVQRPAEPIEPRSTAAGPNRGSGAAQSPFRDRGRITEPSRFFDRHDLLTKLFSDLRIGNNISLVGDSMIGKSSILSMICKSGPQRIGLSPSCFLYIDLQTIDKEDDFYRELCRQINIPYCKGAALAEQLSGRSLVVCIDEIEKMRSDGRRRGFGRLIRTHLRGLADGVDRPLRLVIASRQPLVDLFADDDRGATSPLYNICLQLRVDSFSADIARAFLRARLSSTGISFPAQEEDRMITESRGNPGVLQQMADALFERLTNRP